MIHGPFSPSFFEFLRETFSPAVEGSNKVGYRRAYANAPMTMAPNRRTPANEPNTIVSVVVDDDAPAADPSVAPLLLDDVSACDGSGLYDGDGPAVTTGSVEFPATTSVTVELTQTRSSLGVNMYEADVRTDRVGMYLVEHLSPLEMIPTNTGSSLSSYCHIGPPLSA